MLALNFRDEDDPKEFIAEYGYNLRLFPNADPVAEQWGVKATLTVPEGREGSANLGRAASPSYR